VKLFKRLIPLWCSNLYVLFLVNKSFWAWHGTSQSLSFIPHILAYRPSSNNRLPTVRLFFSGVGWTIFNRFNTRLPTVWLFTCSLLNKCVVVLYSLVLLWQFLEPYVQQFHRLSSALPLWIRLYLIHFQLILLVLYIFYFIMFVL